MTQPGKVSSLNVKKESLKFHWSNPAIAGPHAMPRALALTKPAEAFILILDGTQSLMYRRFTALADPILHL